MEHQHARHRRRLPAAMPTPGAWRGQAPAVRQLVRQPIIQRDPQPAPPVSKPPAPSPDPDPAVFPDFPSLIPQLRLNLEENLYANAHHFYAAAALYPNDPAKMEETFARYAVGANFLETGFQFLGFGSEAASWLALGSGLAYKGYTFATDGVLQLDYQLDLTDAVKLETKVDLSATSGDPTEVDRVDVGLGVVGHF